MQTAHVVEQMPLLLQRSQQLAANNTQLAQDKSALQAQLDVSAARIANLQQEVSGVCHQRGDAGGGGRCKPESGRARLSNNRDCRPTTAFLC